MSVVPPLDLDTVAGLIIYHLDDTIAVPAAVRPEQLRTLRSVRRFTTADPLVIRAVYDAVCEGKPAPDGNPPDARWGAVFLSADRLPLFAAYVDRFGVQGAVDERVVCFAYPTLLQRLREAFAP